MESADHLSQYWDQRLEKYGWDKELVDYASDYGISLSVGSDEKKEWLDMLIEHVHLTQPDLTQKLPVYGLAVEYDRGAATVRMRVPARAVVCGFMVAIGSLKITTAGLEEGPGSDTSGVFFLQVLSLVRPEDRVSFSFRSEFNDQDIERRRLRRTATS